MKNVPKLLFVLFMLSLLLAVNLCLHSCKKEPASGDVVSALPAKAFPRMIGVEQVQGRLKFASETDLQQTLQMMRENQNSLPGFEQQFPGFVSNRMAFDAYSEAPEQYNDSQIADFAWIKKEGDDETAEPAVDGVLLSCIANEKGLFQVGEDILKVGHDQIYKVQESVWRAMPQGQSWEHLAGVQVLPISRNKVEVATDRNTTCEQYYMCSSACARKMWGGIETNGCGPYSEIRVALLHYKRGFLGRWYRRKAARMFFQGSVSFDYTASSGGPFSTTTNMSGTNTAYLFDVLDSHFCLGICPPYCYCVLRPTRVDYNVLCEDNLPRSCQTIE